MIHVTRINQQPFVLNSDLIEHIEATPDTVITMTNGQKLVVADSAEAVVEKIVAFRRSIHPAPAEYTAERIGPAAASVYTQDRVEK